jgi:hypothetical protein
MIDDDDVGNLGNHCNYNDDDGDYLMITYNNPCGTLTSFCLLGLGHMASKQES